jgi:hypothetical protein
MKRTRVLCVISGLVLACCLSATAQEIGAWRPANKTAESITGDIVISDAKLSINFSTFPIARIRDLAPSEVSAVFDADSNARAAGSLYRLIVPASRKFLHRNTLCGSEDTQWMAAYVTGRSLHLAFFSGQKMPVFTLDAISNTTDLCGTFSYVR